MLPSRSNCTPVPLPPLLTTEDEDRAYVLLATTTATLSLVLNLIQFLVIVRQRLLRTHLVLGHLCVCGQLASASVLWYIWRVLSSSSSSDDYLLCLLLPSGLHLLVLFTFGPLVTLLVLQHHRLVRGRRDAPLVVGLLVTLVWCQAVLVSLVPLTGWNDWGGVCRLALVWRPAFSLIVCVLYFLHYPMVVILLADHCLHSSRPRRSSSVSPASTIDEERNLYVGSSSTVLNSSSMSPSIDKEENNLYVTSSTTGLHSFNDEARTLYITSSDDFRPRSVLLLLGLYASCTLPFVICTAWQGAWGSADPCGPLVAGEKAAAWTSWLTVLFAALRPLFHLLLEEEVSEGTVSLVSALFNRQVRLLDV